MKVTPSNKFKKELFLARYPVPALPEPEFEIREQHIPLRHKYLIPVPLNPYTERNQVILVNLAILGILVIR